MNRVCTICARGGSKGVKGKNIRSLNGVPLIGYTIKHAQSSGIFDAICVSSDSQEILDVAEKFSVDLIVERPSELASDTAGKIPAIVHALQTAEQRLHTSFSTLVDLDATSPLRLPEDIAKAVEILETTGCSNVITGCPARRSPYFNLVEMEHSGKIALAKHCTQEIKRRQDAPKCFDMNASIYVWNKAKFLANPGVFYEDTRLLVMPAARSVDIDEEIDWLIVETIMNQGIFGEGTSYEARP
ncbi:MAG: acylneuraminate cytidylyltransferase family protein [Candidatus Melainabacteria bacterium]|nr:MAG: acylneuraminate cytidylyltransferase family protein [Candidatus Melainabacteria bacterium]